MSKAGSLSTKLKEKDGKEKMKELRRKSFEELVGVESDREWYSCLAKLAEEVSQEKEIFSEDELPDYPEVSDEEVEIRVKVLLRGWKDVERKHRKAINGISFELNRKFAKGCQARELIESYNKMIGQFQDAFIF